MEMLIKSLQLKNKHIAPQAKHMVGSVPFR